MADAKDITGLRFGKLVAVEVSHRENGVYWRCRCDCGGERVTKGDQLRRGLVTNCGCFLRGGRKRPEPWHLYAVWRNMLARCTNPKSSAFKWYGARGIAVCEEWQTFPPFRAWALANGWRRGLHTNRIDNNGNYSPDNCEFVTAKVNANNELGVRPKSLQNRFQRKWPLERIFTEPFHKVPRRGVGTGDAGSNESRR
jgi:hypothetical protein